MKKSSLFLLFGFMALGSVSALGQNLILDSGFSTPDITSAPYPSTNTYAYGNGYNGTDSQGGPLTGTPWTFTNQTGLAVANGNGGFAVPADQGFGAQVAFLQYNATPPGGNHPMGGGLLSQTFSVGSLDVYTLIFSFLNRGTSDLLSFNVSLTGGNANFSQDFTGSLSLQTPTLSLGSLNPGSYTLTFTALTADLGTNFDGTVFIDNVAVVPEPGTWLAGGLAMAGCGVFLARRRQKPAVIATV